MSIYVLGSKTGILQRSYESTPRAALITDTQETDGLPPEIRAVVDLLIVDELAPWAAGRMPDSADATIACFQGEALLRGTAESLRASLFIGASRIFVPVRYPGIAEFDVDLIALEPRIQTGRNAVNRSEDHIRLSGNPAPSAARISALERAGQWWARHTLALLAEQRRKGDGLRPLQEIWQKEEMTAQQKALVLRNLSVILLSQSDYAKAGELLIPGMDAFPDYAELPYLSAVSLIQQGKPSQAVGFLERALARSNTGFISGGGENSCRAQWLLGSISLLLGREEMAFRNFLPSIHQRPAFRPGVEELLKLRVPQSHAERIQWPLCELVRREPKYLVSALNFLRTNGKTAAAERLLRAFSSEGVNRSDSRPEPFGVITSGNHTSLDKPAVALQGPFLVHSSLARVNRELGCALMKSRQWQVGLEPQSFGTHLASDFEDSHLLEQGLSQRFASPELTIRLSWPPDFRRPATGRLACILPWEYAAVPLKWVELIERNVDELWVPSDFVRDAFLRAGVGPQKIRTIPLGFDPRIFASDGPRWKPAGVKKFMFLFVGGLIPRKGIDLLLDAFGEAFTVSDDVSLVIKDIGSHSYYQHNSLGARVQELAGSRSYPHVQLLSEEFDDRQMAGLYRSADVLVHPYRGEGFGLPPVEAMACGKPVITTQAGPALEICKPESSFFIPATVDEVPYDPPPLGRLSENFTWFEPDLEELALTLRKVHSRAGELADLGSISAAHVHQRYTWPMVCEQFLNRARVLVNAPEMTPVA